MNANLIADALEKCDWSGVSIGNKEILKAAVIALRTSAQEAQRKPKPTYEYWRNRGAAMFVAERSSSLVSAYVRGVEDGWDACEGPPQADTTVNTTKDEERPTESSTVWNGPATTHSSC